MLDLTRTIIGRELGNEAVDPNAVFQAGMVAARGASGITTTDGTTRPVGILKWNKATTIYGTEVKEAVVLTGTTASNLKHSNVSNVLVENAAGTNYTVTTDYTVNAVNGTITRNGGGGITSGATVYVTYTYQKTEAEKRNDGLNFGLNMDDTAGSNKITVISGFSTVYTDQYDTSKDYALEDKIYPTSGGKLTNSFADSTHVIGRVVFVPTAPDAYLGVEGMFGANL